MRMPLSSIDHILAYDKFGFNSYNYSFSGMIHVAALILLSITSALAIQCYSGSQLQVIECPSVNCIKQTLGFDTVSTDGVFACWLGTVL